MKNEIIFWVCILWSFIAGIVVASVIWNHKVEKLRVENKKLKRFNNSILNPPVIHREEKRLALVKCCVDLPNEYLHALRLGGSYAHEKIIYQLGKEIFPYVHAKVWLDAYRKQLLCEARVEVAVGAKAGSVEWKVPEGYCPDSIIKEDIYL